jgi:pimeloyl-ACP methyl ester carboxylesterase
MTTFVLVHGSWAGGWNWARLRPLLEAEGHRVLCPTLSGLADRGHLAGDHIGLSTHIEDITRLLTWEDLDQVVLVGHSYGGMVVTGVLGEVPERIARIAYIDAFRPEPGQSAFDVLPVLPDLFGEPPPEHPWGWSPIDLTTLGITDPADLAWMAAKCTPMPTLTHREPLPHPENDASAVPITYVQAAAAPFFTETAEKAAAAGATVLTWPDAAHYPHVQHPQRTARVLLDLC